MKKLIFLPATVALALAVGLAPSAAQGATPFFDHLKCYKIRDTAKFLAGVDLTAAQSQFGFEQCRVKGKGMLFCVPVDKQVTTFINKTKPPLVPGNLPAQELQEDRICYKLKCPKVAIDPLEVTDQFGTRKVGKFKPKLLCTPAIKGTTTTTTTTTSTTTTVPPPVDCGQATAPECLGLCPTPGDTCIFDTTLDRCRCQPPTDNTCDPALTPAPQCNGVCPSGLVCIQGGVCKGGTVPCVTDADCPATGTCQQNSFCDCLPFSGVACGTLAGPPQCWGDCPAPTTCQVGGAVGCICQ